MKQPRPKPHIVDSEFPLTEGTNQRAICGAVIHKAKFVFFFDDQSLCDVADLFNNVKCKGCMRADILHRYVYGAIDGESAKQGEAE